MGGNPLATLSWTLGDRSLVGVTHSRDSYASSELELVPTKEDDGAKLVCLAESVALEMPFAVDVEITVQYPPEAVKVNFFFD